MKNRSGKFALLMVIATIAGHVGLAGDGTEKTQQVISFKDSVMPVLRKYCLPCHADDSNNPSQLSLDSYKLLMEGGKHGSAVVVGKPEESSLIQKLSEKPPFGDPMPLSRRRRSQEPPKKLTEEEIRILTEWVRQGAREN